MKLRISIELILIMSFVTKKETYVLLMVTFNSFLSVSLTTEDSLVTSSMTCVVFRTKSPFV